MSNDNICISGDTENGKLTINIIKCCSKHPPLAYSHGDKEELDKVKKGKQKTSFGFNEELNERLLQPVEYFENEFGKTTKEKSCQASFLESLKVNFDFNEKSRSNQSLNDTRSHPLMETYSSRDQMFSPTKSERMFPEVPARYHGLGCAMEIDVLEKHHAKCRFRKNPNPQRKSREEQSGSYEIIGRLVFKTCDDSVEDLIPSQIPETPNPTFYSFVNNFRNPIVHGDNDLKLQNIRSEVLPRINDSKTQIKDIMDLKISKSLNSLSNGWNFECNKCAKCLCTDCKCVSLNDILFISSNCDNCTQTMKPRKLCACLNSTVSYLMKQFHKLNCSHGRSE